MKKYVNKTPQEVTQVLNFSLHSKLTGSSGLKMKLYYFSNSFINRYANILEKKVRGQNLTSAFRLNWFRAIGCDFDSPLLYSLYLHSALFLRI